LRSQAHIILRERIYLSTCPAGKGRGKTRPPQRTTTTRNSKTPNEPRSSKARIPRSGKSAIGTPLQGTFDSAAALAKLSLLLQKYKLETHCKTRKRSAYRAGAGFVSRNAGEIVQEEQRHRAGGDGACKVSIRAAKQEKELRT
jgi:hypothetical protein